MIWRPQGLRQVILNIARASGRWAEEMRQPRSRASSERSGPTWHKTGATRVESVSSKAVAKAFLGHADEDVTDSYIAPGIEEVRDVVNRAARAIDGGDIPRECSSFGPRRHTRRHTGPGSSLAQGAEDRKSVV